MIQKVSTGDFPFSVPIFDGNEINRKIKNARINEENAALNYLKAKQDLESELYQLYNVYSNNLRMIEFEEESRSLRFSILRLQWRNTNLDLCPESSSGTFNSPT